MKKLLPQFLFTLLLFANLHRADAQGTTAFTYQGQLKDNGTNASGTYTMIFKLYDAVSAGNQVGGTLTTGASLANGLFSVNLDFGNVFTGNARWLDITVTNGGVTQTLSPRVQVLPAPYAQFAAVAASVTNNAITATQLASGAVTNRNLAANAVNGTNIAGGQVVKTLNGLTDAVNFSAGTNMTLTTNGNTLQISTALGIAPGSVPNGMQLYFGSNNASFTGTFVVPANITRIMVEVWGGGGGGGGGYEDDVNNIRFSGGGGGAGAYAIQLFTVTPGASYAVVAGAAGAFGSATNSGGAGFASSFGGTLLSAGGGGGGAASIASNGAGGLSGFSTNSIFPSSLAKDGAGGSAFGGTGAAGFRGGAGGIGLGGGLSDGVTPGGGGVGGGGGTYSGPTGGKGGKGVVIITY